MAEATGLIVLPAVFLGLVIGIYEALLLHRDVKVPTHRFTHTIHALVFAVIAVFASMNVDYVLSLLTFLQAIPLVSNPLVFRIIVGLIAVLKIHGASAAIKSSVGGASVGMKETWTHSLIIGVLIVVAPYVWPLIAQMMPGWLQ